MENASKALIIAGAILLAIVLVSLGVLVINNSRKDIDNQNIDQASIDAFNSKITAYCGTNKSGTDMNNLIDAISASNGAQTNKAEKHPINVTATEQALGISATTNKKIYGYVLGSGGAMQKADSSQSGYPRFDNSRKYGAWAALGSDGYVYQVNIYKN